MGDIYFLFYPNDLQSITTVLLVKKCIKKCPKTSETITYELTYALKRPASPSAVGEQYEEYISPDDCATQENLILRPSYLNYIHIYIYNIIYI